ncbi:MAG: DNA polymerase III subunit [Chloroflexi bacterium]|nr:DNA polymerase III subunit [Chloroflexota bacterium]
MSGNWGLLGHEWAVQLLKGQIGSGRLRHAYLFTGPDGVGRRTLALRLAQALNCTNPPAPGEFCGDCRACRGFARAQHPDLLIIERQEGDREIKIAAVRELSRSLSRTPLEARFQIALLLDFEFASEEAANALLKTLEEPSPSVVLCLTAPDADSLPTTIVSRCELLRLRPVPVAQLASALAARLSVQVDKAGLLSSLSGGCPGLALKWHQQPEALEQRTEWLEAGEKLLYVNRVQRFAFAEKVSRDREALRGLLFVWLTFWRDLVICTGHSSAPISNMDKQEALDNLAARLTLTMAQKALRATERALGQLNTNVNARLAMEGLLLQLPAL